ncbi:MAG TPA: hypothetical protein VFG62_16280 [Rhodopila sp.]|nr:hypothetical protein [Rhodopila sp.]
MFNELQHGGNERDRQNNDHGRQNGSHGSRPDDLFPLCGGNGFGDSLLFLSPPLPIFISLVDAVIAAPPNRFIAGGQNGPTASNSQVFWTYTPGVGLFLEAASGFLTTQTGNGGFNLFVGADGDWTLSFDGSKTVIGSDDKSHIKPPPAGNMSVTLPAGASSYNAAAGNITVNGSTGWDTIQGGVGDYMIGGSGTLGGGLAGNGNCALYSASAGPVLVDMQNGHGYGGNAEGNTLVNMNQVRGSLYTNVLIGSSSGTDIKSGGDNSILISTGGSGYELRPDGTGNILVSTVGADRINFDPTHGWKLGDQNILLGFNTQHGDYLDLTLLLNGTTIPELAGGSVASNFFTTSAVDYSAATGHGNIAAYVALDDETDGTHVMFSATGQVQTAGTDILDMKFVHGLSVQNLFAHGAIVA